MARWKVQRAGAGSGEDGQEGVEGAQVGAAGLVEEAEDELVGARVAQGAGGLGEGAQVGGGAGGEAVGGAEHHPDGQRDGGPDLAEGGEGGGEAVGGHVGDQFQPVGSAFGRRDGVPCVEGDHLQEGALVHG